MTHPSKILITCCGHPADIDVEMIRVCTATWARGIHTQWCCQGDDDGTPDETQTGSDVGLATLAFPDMAEADKFAQVVYDLHRAHVTGQEPPGITGWKWWLHGLRMPMTSRMIVALLIPRGELAGLADWIESSAVTPEHPAAAEPVAVNEHAGTEITAGQHREYEKLMAADEDDDDLDDDDLIELSAAERQAMLYAARA